jgi:hypothetical protein
MRGVKIISLIVLQNYFIFIPSPYPLPEGEGKRKKPENSSAMTIYHL